jgi:hypothetical protein
MKGNQRVLAAHRLEMKLDITVGRDRNAELSMYVADGLLVEVGAADDGIFNRLARIVVYNTFHNSILCKTRC